MELEEFLTVLEQNSKITCVCYFGGSPEPQLPFTIRVANKIIKQSGNKKHICWEWNGCGNRLLVRKVAALAVKSGGTVKFDLKAFNLSVGKILCGVHNTQSYLNFKIIAEEFNNSGIIIYH